MKKVFIILSVIIVLLVAVSMALPLAFKNEIRKVALSKVNASMNATLSYSEFELSLIKSFPDFTASFHNLSVVGKAPFEKDTLVSFSKLSASIDLPSLMKRKGIVIEKIFIEGLNLKMMVNAEGMTNWDIVKTPVEKVTLKNTEPSVKGREMKFVMKGIYIRNMNFIYDDRKGNYNFSVFKAEVSVSGKLEGMLTGLDIQLNAPSINFEYDSVKYVNRANLSLQTRLTADFDKFQFNFNTGQSKLNNLPLSVMGGFSMLSDSMLFDIKFEIPNMTMQQMFSMVPNNYGNYLKDLNATGNLSFSGIIKGLYFEDVTPLINIRFKINNGVLRYPGLPDELKVQEASALIYKPEGGMDLLMIGIENLDMKLAGNPLNFKATLKSIFTDPNLDIKLKGKIDIESLTKFFPIDSISVKGLVNADLAFIGNMSDIKENNFEKFISSGNIRLEDFYFQNNTLPKGFTIHKVSVVLTNQHLNISGFNGLIGKTDFKFDGNLDNVFSFLFADGELKGNLNLTSNMVDANEFITNGDKTTVIDEKIGANDTIQNSINEPMVLPAHVSLLFQATIKQLLYDKMDISNFTGRMELKNQQLTLHGLDMEMLGGTLNMKGMVIADGRQYPDIDFGLDIVGFDLPKAFNNLSIVQKYLPFAEKTEGEFSTAFNIRSKLGEKLKMMLSTVTAHGTFSTNNVKMVDSQSFNSLKSIIQSSKLKNLELDNCSVEFEIRDGNLYMKPFRTALAQQPITISGVYNLGGTLNYRIDAVIDREILSGNIQDVISYVPGHESITKVEVGIDITGDIKKPDVKFDTDKIKKQVVDQVKKSSVKEIKDAAKKLFDKFLK